MKMRRGKPSEEIGYWTSLSESLGKPANVLDDNDALILLKAALERDGSHAVFANRHGVHRTYISKVLNGGHPVSHANAIVKALGLRRVYVAE
jgi:DNA-binding phage protein